MRSDVDLASEAAKFGPYAFMLFVILGAVYLISRDYMAQSDRRECEREARETARYAERQELNARMLNVISENTKAMQALADMTQAEIAQIGTHDARVGSLGEKIERIDQTTMRIERIVSAPKGA